MRGATALAMCASAGDWLLLKNLHLVVAWLPLLEKEVHSLPADARHPGFRLFLTTEAHPRFPPTLLEGALKVRGVCLLMWYSHVSMNE
jgi:dynein heavy chain 2